MWSSQSFNELLNLIDNNDVTTLEKKIRVLNQSNSDLTNDEIIDLLSRAISRISPHAIVNMNARWNSNSNTSNKAKQAESRAALQAIKALLTMKPDLAHLGLHNDLLSQVVELYTVVETGIWNHLQEAFRLLFAAGADATAALSECANTSLINARHDFTKIMIEQIFIKYKGKGIALDANIINSMRNIMLTDGFIKRVGQGVPLGSLVMMAAYSSRQLKQYLEDDIAKLYHYFPAGNAGAWAMNIVMKEKPSIAEHIQGLMIGLFRTKLPAEMKLMIVAMSIKIQLALASDELKILNTADKHGSFFKLYRTTGPKKIANAEADINQHNDDKEDKKVGFVIC